MTSGSVPFTWTDDHQAAFEQLKTFLTHDPLLLSSDFTKPFTLHTDASNQAAGAALLQEKEGVVHPVAYHSAEIDVHQRRYSIIKKELFFIISAVKKFQCYVQPSHVPL